MGIRERDVLNGVCNRFYSDGHTLSDMSDDQVAEIYRLLKTARDTDYVHTRFPDFICDGGWIEHFALTFGRSSNKGYENVRLEQQSLLSCGVPLGPWKIVSIEFSAGSYDNFKRSLDRVWKKHIDSFRKSELSLMSMTGVFLLEIDDRSIMAYLYDEERHLIRDFYSVLFDKQFLDFIYESRNVVKYVLVCYQGHRSCDLIVLDDIPMIKEKYLKQLEISFCGVHSIVEDIVPRDIGLNIGEEDG